MSGSFSKNFTFGLALYCEWSSVQNVVGCYSDVTVKLYVDSFSLYGVPVDCNITIDNIFSPGQSNLININNNYYTEKHLLRECTSRVYHNSDGTKSCFIECIWNWMGTYGGQFFDNLIISSTVILPRIDRSPPSVSCEVINIQTYSFEIKGTSSDLSDEWKYSIDNGQSWQSFPNNPVSKQANVQITNAQDNTQYNVQVQARKQYNHVVGYSQNVQITTPKEQTPPTISCEVINIQPYSFEIKGTSSDLSDEWKYSLNGGQNWQSFPNNPVSNQVNVQITDAQENTQYNVQIQARKQYNGIVGYSETVKVSTPKEQSPPTISCEVVSIGFNIYEIEGSSSDWADEWKYSLDGGQNWIPFPNNPINYKANVKLKDLSYNTKYDITIQARKQYNQVIGYSEIINIITPKRPITDESKPKSSILKLCFTIFF